MYRNHPLIVSIHIPKTGGTSLLKEIKCGALGNFLLDYDDLPNRRGWRQALRRTRNKLAIRLNADPLTTVDVVHGHFLADKYWWMADRAAFVAFVREPVSRTLSHFFYFKYVASLNPHTRQQNEMIEVVANGQMDIVEFARSFPMKHMYERFIGGRRLDDFTMFGVTERYNDSIRMLNTLFNASLQGRHERQTNYQQYRNEYQHALPAVAAANRENTRLYKAALARFENDAGRLLV